MEGKEWAKEDGYLERLYTDAMIEHPLAVPKALDTHAGGGTLYALYEVDRLVCRVGVLVLYNDDRSNCLLQYCAVS